MAKQQQQQSTSSTISPSFTTTTTTNDDELCKWELVNQSDCSDAFSDFDVHSFDDFVVDDDDHDDVDVVVAEEAHEEEVKIDPTIVAVDDDAVNHMDLSNYDDDSTHQGHFGNFDIHDVDSHVIPANYAVNDVVNHVDVSNYGDNHHQGYFGNFTAHHYVNVVDDVDDEVDDVDDDEVDDDLVPWEMKGIYMKQRMKKSEKKYITNMCKSRKVFKTVRARYAKAY